MLLHGWITRETIEALAALEAEVIAAGSIIDRSGGRAEVGVPRVSLATLDVAAFARLSVKPAVAAIRPSSPAAERQPRVV